MKMTDERLVRAYVRGDSYRQMSERFAVPINSVAHRIKQLRLKGVRLPRRHSVRRDVDTKRLNVIVDREARRRSRDR